MSQTPEQQSADKIELLYYWALTQLGITTVSQGMNLWQSLVPSSGGVQFYARWLTTTLAALSARRDEGARLGVTYYRLARALRTGKTLAVPELDGGRPVTIERLMADFIHAVDVIDPNLPNPVRPPVLTGSGSTIPTDGSISLTEITSRLDREAEQQARENLSTLGSSALEKANKQPVDPEANPKLADVIDIHSKAGARTAAELERLSMNAARGLVYDLGAADKAAIGWVRYSTTGTPCGWCAMLISRGPVYKRKTASNELGDVDRYHPNCHCIAVPVFSLDQYENSPLFALNRQYADEWPSVTAGHGSGKEAIAAWRRHIRLQQQAQPHNATQVAA